MPHYIFFQKFAESQSPLLASPTLYIFYIHRLWYEKNAERLYPKFLCLSNHTFCMHPYLIQPSQKGHFYGGSEGEILHKGHCEEVFFSQNWVFIGISEIFLPRPPQKLVFIASLLTNFPNISKKSAQKKFSAPRKTSFLQYFPVEQRAFFAPAAPAKQRAGGATPTAPAVTKPLVLSFTMRCLHL